MTAMEVFTKKELVEAINDVLMMYVEKVQGISQSAEEDHRLEQVLMLLRFRIEYGEMPKNIPLSVRK